MFDVSRDNPRKSVTAEIGLQAISPRVQTVPSQSGPTFGLKKP